MNVAARLSSPKSWQFTAGKVYEVRLVPAGRYERLFIGTLRSGGMLDPGIETDHLVPTARRSLHTVPTARVPY